MNAATSEDDTNPIDIDSDVEHAFGSASAPRPAKPNKPPLFLGDSDDSDAENGKPVAVPPPPLLKPRPDLDALFAEVNDEDFTFQPLAPSLDLDAIARKAQERHALSQHPILPSSSPPRDIERSAIGGNKGKDDKDADGRKKRVQPVRLDEARLLSTSHGFPQLISSTKGFKPKGKGHEVRNVVWVNDYLILTRNPGGGGLEPAHEHLSVLDTQAVPQDPVQRHRRSCREAMSFQAHACLPQFLCYCIVCFYWINVAQVALSVWRDEAKGIINGVNRDDLIDVTSDNEAEGNSAKGPTREPTRPPSSPSTRSSLPPDDDFDIDEVIRQDEERRARERQVTQKASLTASSPMGDPNDDLSAAMDGSLAGPVSVPVSNSALDEDEDMWDILREREQEEQRKANVVGELSTEMRDISLPAGYDGINGTNDEDMDDLYM
jgi:replication fork protection complex subunit Csm3/Swi3